MMYYSNIIIYYNIFILSNKNNGKYAVIATHFHCMFRVLSLAKDNVILEM